MKITTVIPCHNSEKWIERTLKSVVAQTRKSDEIIVILDNCTDNSKKIVEQLNLDCRLIETDCGNGAGARNVGIQNANGDWIAFNDADDIWYLNHLEAFERIVTDTDCVAYTGVFDCFRWNAPDQIFHKHTGWSIEAPITNMSSSDFLEKFIQQGHFFMPSCAIKKTVLDEIGGFNEKFVRRHDIHMFLKAITKGRLAYNPISTGAYQVDTPGSISRSLFDACCYRLWVMIDLQKNYYPGSALMEKLIQHSAYLVCNTAWMEANSDNIKKAFPVSFKYLSLFHKIFFASTRFCTWAYRFPNSIRRKIIYKSDKPGNTSAI